MARRPDSAAPSPRHPSQLLALAIGAVYTLIGVLGFFITGFDNFAAETNETLLGFEINPLHNLVHLAIVPLTLAASASCGQRRGQQPTSWLAVGCRAPLQIGDPVAGAAQLSGERIVAVHTASSLHLAV